MFISSSLVPNGAIGSLAAADAFCQQAANGRSLGGTWKAWLSDATTSASDRLTHATVPYKLLNGVTVANDFDDLIDGTIAHGIDVYETGVTIPAPQIDEVWTGTTSLGRSSGSNCMNWTNSTAQLPHASVGLSNETGFRWTQAYVQFCDRAVRLYCFEQ